MAQATSTTTTITAPVLAGVWLHDPSDAEDTIQNFLYGNVGRSESLGVSAAPLRFIGRALPVYDMGGFESQELKINITVPSGPFEQDTVEWFRTAARNRRVLCYRDNRGRVSYGIIGGLTFTDIQIGTTVEFPFITTDYQEAV